VHVAYDRVADHLSDWCDWRRDSWSRGSAEGCGCAHSGANAGRNMILLSRPYRRSARQRSALCRGDDLSKECRDHRLCDEATVPLRRPAPAKDQQLAQLRRAIGPQRVGRLRECDSSADVTAGAQTACVDGHATQAPRIQLFLQRADLGVDGRCGVYQHEDSCGTPGDLRSKRAPSQGIAGPGNVTPASVDHEGNRHLVDAAAATGADVVMVSVVGATARHPMELFRAKYAAEQHLRASTAPWTIVRATAFLEMWAEILGKGIVFGRGDNPINGARGVAASIAALAEDPTLDMASTGSR
jgi:hypothetical protein